MPAEDQDDKTVWPPAPSFGYLPPSVQVQPKIAPWPQAMRAALAGGAIGAVLLPLLVFLGYLVNGGAIEFWLLLGFVATLIGAIFGAFIGLAAFAVYKLRKMLRR